MKQPQSYYGGFFWLAATSFIVPLFVAYAAFEQVKPTTKPSPAPDVSGVDQNLWDYLLRRYVENGLVDYEGMSRDYLFTEYLKQVAGCDPTKLDSTESRLALHCNAYNALVINGVVTHKIHRNERNVLNYTPKEVAEKVKELDLQIEALKRRPESDPSQIEELVKKADKLRSDSQFFRLKEHVFANQTISLDQLEQEMIRPVFNEPRIHVALVCAAKSCPAIRAEAYIGERIEKQLQDQSVQFANNRTYVDYDPAMPQLNLSPILSWYSSDWSSQGGYLAWLKTLVEDDELREKLAMAESGELKVSFNQYDWTLNSQEGGSSAAGAAGGGFGSGSVPNE